MRKSLVTAALAATFLTTRSLCRVRHRHRRHQVARRGQAPTSRLPTARCSRRRAGWSFTTYKVGDKVKVTYQLQNGKMMASEIIKAS